MQWKNFKIGSYFLRQTKLSKISSEHKEAESLYEFTDISIPMRALDLLGQVKWKINKKVLEVNFYCKFKLTEYIWAHGGGKGEIPSRFNPKAITKTMLKSSDFKNKIILLKESQHNRELHSLRCDFNLKLQIASDFKKINALHFPHNMDYRGRAYPITPHLNHIGNDFCRGLLEYSISKPLGKNGLKWLKVSYRLY